MAEREKGEIEIPHGRVEKVCKQWLVKEDGVYANRLQNEEIQSHYEGNRFKSKVNRNDLQAAKYLQNEELEIILDQHMLHKELSSNDELIAKQIQDKLMMDELNEARRKEMEDELLAKKLQQKEKEKLMKRRLAKEIHQVEKVRLETKLSYNTDDSLSNGIDSDQNNDDEQNYGSSASNEIRRNQIDFLNEIDLSDFLMKPPPGLSEAQLKKFYDDQDAELALFLQQQELKTKDSALIEKKMLIEQQDYEIAKILQEEEKAKAKRLKAKLKQRQLLKQQQLQQANQNHETNDANISQVNQQIVQNGLNHVTSSKFIEENNHHLNNRDNILRNHSLTDIDQEGYYVNTHHHQQEHYDDETVYDDPDELTSNIPPLPTYHNIAIDLDPTYKRNSQVNSDTNSSNGVYFAQVCHVSPTLSSSPDSIGTSSLPRNHNLQVQETNFSTISSSGSFQYLPVPGQKRLTNEKTKTKKHNRDTCKTQ